MALDFVKKKRTNLLNIVDRLVEKTQERNAAITPKKQEDVFQPSPRPGITVKSFLLPPTPSSGPGSPSISEGSVSDEEQVTDKPPSKDEGAEEIKKDHGIPKKPQRCEVCGLRVYKSYRYISRSSAPIHLKNFVAQNERIRVCKRCFSSRERCRENLALVLLRSKTKEMSHVRTPLGVTYNRTTKGMDYIARDLKKHLKRPYEDLLCDETLADEDEMEVDNDRFTLNHTAAKDQENGSANQGITVPVPFQRKDVGIVTVVKQQRGKFSSTPNCFTIYGEGGNLKLIDICMATDKATDQSGNGPAIDATEHLQKLVDYRSPSKKEVSSTTHSEINNINNKLTFLDHAYALPPPKGKAPAALRTQAVNKVKPVVPTKTIKAPNTTKQEIQKNEASLSSSSSSSSDGPGPTVRNCGIVCFLCNNLVTKSYSCYKKENAPEKIKHLFTPSVKVVKVCRRCMPYKKPKETDGASHSSKAKSKVVKGKLAKMKSAKLIKNAKSNAKGNASKETEKKVTDKSPVKSPTKDDKKLSPSKKQSSVIVQTKKMPPIPQGKVTKVVNSKSIQITLKNVVTAKGLAKPESGKVTSVNAIDANVKLSSNLSKAGIVKRDSHASEADISKNDKIEKETRTNNKHESTKVDSGTQSMKSLIGMNKLKTKLEDSGVADVSSSKERKSASLNLKEDDSSKTAHGEGCEKLTQEDATNVREVTISTSHNDCAMGEDIPTQHLDSEEGPKQGTVSVSCPEKDQINDEPKECETRSKTESEDDNQEVKNKEVCQGAMEGEGESMKESRIITDSLIVRETRSASQSPLRAREVKSSEVSSPRRGRSSGTPDKKHEDYKQIMPTVMTRKRLASFSESEAEKKADSTTVKRRAVVALLEKMSSKSNSSTSTQNASVKKETEESKKKGEPSDAEAKGHPMTRRNQMSINCPGCNEKVVKSYRCLSRGTAPQHIKPLFEQQSAEMLRVCRKCVNKKWN